MILANDKTAANATAKGISRGRHANRMQLPTFHKEGVGLNSWFCYLKCAVNPPKKTQDK